MSFWRKPLDLPSAADALAGRDTPIEVGGHHPVTSHPITPPWPEGLSTAVFGLGCFWGAERRFWQTDGVWTTAVGYAGGHTPNPTYEEVCSGRTGHAEVVIVVFDPTLVTYEHLLSVFLESHDPTQGMRQGNDIGTQYRSIILTTGSDQEAAAQRATTAYGARLAQAGFGPLTTTIAPLGPLYWAEQYHQQYLFWNPNGYCGLAGTGVTCPVGLFTVESDAGPGEGGRAG